MTMTDIHVPDEVVEVAAKPIYDALEGPVNNQDFTRQMRQWEDAKRIALTALTAALSAWVDCGMAKEGNGFYFPDGKIGANEIEKLTTVPNTFPVLIIRTEAP